MNDRKKGPMQLKPPRDAFDLPDGQNLTWPGGRGNGFSKEGYRITLSPGRREWWNKLRENSTAVTDLLQAVSSFADKRYREIAAEKNRFWAAVAEDLGFEGRAAMDEIFINEDGVVWREQKPPDTGDSSRRRRATREDRSKPKS